MTTDRPLFSRYFQYLCKSIQEISIENLQTKIEQDPSIILIDIRSQSEWDAGHIPNARHIDRGYLELKIESTVDSPETEIVLYCGGGTRSILAAHTLQNMGYHKVRSLSTGFRGWKNKDLPLATSLDGKNSETVLNV